jgi:hypothetical protein
MLIYTEGLMPHIPKIVYIWWGIRNSKNPICYLTVVRPEKAVNISPTAFKGCITADWIFNGLPSSRHLKKFLLKSCTAHTSKADSKMENAIVQSIKPKRMIVHFMSPL